MHRARMCCSCGFMIEESSGVKFKFCPNCGTIYRGEQFVNAEADKAAEQKQQPGPGTSPYGGPFGNARSTRAFDTGATRDVDHDKIDPEAAIAPIVLTLYCQYMKACQIMPDGSRRQDDNWQRGMPRESYMKSGARHFLEWWQQHRAAEPNSYKLVIALFGIMFNVQGYILELARKNPLMVVSALARFEQERKHAQAKDAKR